ncbi:MAG: LAGLIDADG family homing endonuclease [Nitrosopumilus sp.]
MKLPEITLPDPPKTKPVTKSVAYGGALQKKAAAKTKEEKAIIQKTHDLAIAEKAVRAAQRKLHKVTDKADKVLEGVKGEDLDEDMQRLKDAAAKAVEVNPTSLDDNVAFKPTPGPQTEFLAASEDEVFFGGARGGSKCLKLSTLLLTPDGPKELKDVRQGDLLMNPDGTTTKVIQLHSIQPLQVYRLHFSNGATIDACKDHQWAGTLRIDSPAILRDTGWLYERQLTGVKNIAKLRIPLCRPLQYNKKTLKIDPYIVGALLADGCIGDHLGNISHSCHTDDLTFFEEQYQNAGFTERKTYKNKDAECHNIYIRGDSKEYLKEEMVRLGLWGSRSKNKFIPNEYKYSSVEDRVALLQGLCDCDGSATLKSNGRGVFSYHSISEKLITDVIELAESLGYHTRKYNFAPRERHKNGKTYICQPCYRVDFRGNNREDIFRLPRKREIVKKAIPLSVKDVILEKIEKLKAVVPMRCLTVDHANQLFMITGGPGQGFVATHNTYSLIADPLRYINNPNFNALIMRRTTVEARDLIRETRKLYPKVCPGAKYLKSEKIWEFPSGATITFGYGETVDDVERYRGFNITYLGIDELPQYPTSDVYDMLVQSCRTTDPTLKVQIRATGNPGGAGSQWVKERFIDAAPPGKRFWKTSSYLNPITNEEVTVRRSFKFIAATVFDNPYLMRDPSYVAQLASLPETKKRQALYGDWDVVDDGSFPEFNRRHHVVKDFQIPTHWPKFVAIDWGYSSPFCVLWFACDDWGNIFVYREFYGQGILADSFARQVLALEQGERIMYRIIDGSVVAKRGEIGPSVHETLQDNGLHCGFADRSPGSRIMGKQEVHKRLALKFTGELLEDGSPKEAPTVMLFENCLNLIRTLPMMVNDPLDVEKVLKKGADDHAYDAFRYGLSSRPSMPQQIEDNYATNRSLEYKPADPSFGY